MRKDILFEGSAQVHIHGPSVLRFLKYANNAAIFDVIGLQDPSIRIVDKRPNVHRKLAKYLRTGELNKFARYYNAPASVKISHPKRNIMQVQLNNTRVANPHYVLWVASGIQGWIPFYDYKKIQVEFINDEQFALFTLFKETVVKNHADDDSDFEFSPEFAKELCSCPT